METTKATYERKRRMCKARTTIKTVPVVVAVGRRSWVLLEPDQMQQQESAL